MAKSPKKSGEVRDYPVLGAIRNDGEWFAPGDTISMTEDEAAPLIDGGSLGKAIAPAAPAAPTK